MAKKNKTYLSTDYPELNNPFNTLAANIRFASVDRNIKTITITSTVANEGKTNIVLNLGIALANNKKSVLIIEGDMRKRSLAKCLDIHPKYGLYSVLSGKCTIQNAICSTRVDNLCMIDSEPNIPNPVDLISSNMFACLMDFLNSKFDYIIVDTPPLVTFVDGALISSLTDATVLAVRQKLAKKTDVKNAIEQLETANANLIGTILTFNADFKKSQYYYAYYNYEGKRVGDDKNKQFEEEFLPDNVVRQNLNSWYNWNQTGKATKRHQSMENTEDKDESVGKQNGDFASGQNQQQFCPPNLNHLPNDFSTQKMNIQQQPNNNTQNQKPSGNPNNTKQNNYNKSNHGKHAHKKRGRF